MPDIPAGGAATATLRINAADNAPQGPALIPLGISYRDIEGKSYEGKTEVGIRVQIVSQSAQIVLESYHIEPQMVVPGGPIIINATFVNMGTKPATQVMVRVTGGENILLPDSRGDSFSVGNLQPGESRTVQLPLIVNSAAKEGPQLQPLTVTYLEDGEAKESAASLTVPVGKVDLPVPLLLLVSYDTGQTDDLRPGDRFTLKVVLSNVASADAQDTLVTFGTVQSSGTDTSGGGNGGGQQTDTTSPSTTFAPQGNAGRTFIGAFPANSTTEITQEFIVSGSVNSGIYNLPITLQYLLPDNTVKQDVLNVSLVVIAPVRLRINPPQPMPEFVNAGDVVPISLELVNYGKNSINLLSASFSATNAEVMDGAEIPLETLNADGDTSVSGMVMPLEEGEMDVTFTLNYLDDLNQPRTLELTFNAVVEAPIPIIDDGGIDFPPIIEPTPEPDNNWLGRAIMALLGLGS